MVIEIARGFGIPFQEPELTRYDIYTADECFLTGTAAEIIPVISLDKRLIGSGKPGPETARFIDDADGPLPGILAKIPLGRYGHADEVAKLAAFLASDDAAFITGAEIAIDGGDGSVAA